MDDLSTYPFTDPWIATFAIRTLSHYRWIERGDALLELASGVAPDPSKRWRDRMPPFPDQPSGPPYSELHGIFLMLCGFAIENYCKAVLAVRLSETEQQRVKDGGDLPKSLKTHKLYHLCKEVKVPLSPGDIELLTLLEHALVWIGRYPVPTRPAELLPLTPAGRQLYALSAGSREVEESLMLVGGIKQHVCGLLPSPTAA